MKQRNEKYRINVRVKIFGSNWCGYYADFTKGFPVSLYRNSDWIMSNSGQCPQYCECKLYQDGMITIKGVKVDYVTGIDVLNYIDRVHFLKLKMKFTKHSYKDMQYDSFVNKMIKNFFDQHQKKS